MILLTNNPMRVGRLRFYTKIMCVKGVFDLAKLHDARGLDPQLTERLLHKQGQTKFRPSFSLLENF